jgi:parallel beta-helix repeat protein
LLIPIITPSFFSSEKCREEVERFVARELQLGGQQLIFPVYYASTEQMDDPDVRASNNIAALLHAREYADWRKLRLEDFTSREVRVTLDALAVRIRDALQAPGDQVLAVELDEAEPGTSAPASRLRLLVRRPEASSAPAPRTGRTIFVVDQYGQGDFRSIGEAMRAARPGDLIRVRPGLYQESLLIDKPLEILGDGSREDVTVQAFGRDVLVFAADVGRVTNLTLRQIGGGARWNGVFIQRGRLELEECDITCDSLSGIGVVKGADPLITGNAIHDCRQAGILIYDSGRGTLRDNDIFRNAFAGVEIKTGGNPTLTRNKIHECGHAGIFVHDSGLGLVEDNEIYAMPSYAVTIKTRGNPTLVRNTIHDCARAGVFIFDQGAGQLRENVIYGTGYSAVAIKEGADPVLRSNVIRDSKEAGILVSNGGLGTIEDNDIFNNELDGVQVRTDANPTLRRNRIFDNKKQPILISQGGRAILDDNELNGADSRDEPTERAMPWYSFRSRHYRAAGRRNL